MPPAAATKRLTREFQNISKNPPPYIVAHPSETNILEWHYIITGPPNTPYDGGQYWGMWILRRPSSHLLYSVLTSTRYTHLSQRLPLRSPSNPYAHSVWSISAIHPPLPQHIRLPPQILQPCLGSQHNPAWSAIFHDKRRDDNREYQWQQRRAS